MKFATLVIFACLKCVTVKSQGSLRVEDKSSNKAATAAELTQVDDPKTNDDAIVNADERAEADWGLKSSVREAMVCTPLWYINCDVCRDLRRNVFFHRQMENWVITILIKYRRYEKV
jgi:hypothetical protein